MTKEEINSLHSLTANKGWNNPQTPFYGENTGPRVVYQLTASSSYGK